MPGVSAQPGCMAWKETPDPSDASHPLVHEDQLGPLGPGVGDRAVVLVRSHLERARSKVWVYMPPEDTWTTREGVPARQCRQQQAGQEVGGGDLGGDGELEAGAGQGTAR